MHIAREGFRKTPIHFYEWLAAARQCEELVVEEKRNWFGKLQPRVSLKSDRNTALHLGSDGLIRAEAPSTELLIVMYRLADMLNAGVYSNSLRSCKTIEDGERRARKYRWRSVGRFEKFKKYLKSKQRRLVTLGKFAKLVSWVLIVTLFVGGMGIVILFVT